MTEDARDACVTLAATAAETTVEEAAEDTDDDVSDELGLEVGSRVRFLCSSMLNQQNREDRPNRAERQFEFVFCGVCGGGHEEERRKEKERRKNEMNKRGIRT